MPSNICEMCLSIRAMFRCDAKLLRHFVCSAPTLPPAHEQPTPAKPTAQLCDGPAPATAESTVGDDACAHQRSSPPRVAAAQSASSTVDASAPMDTDDAEAGPSMFSQIQKIGCSAAAAAGTPSGKRAACADTRSSRPDERAMNQRTIDQWAEPRAKHQCCSHAAPPRHTRAAAAYVENDSDSDSDGDSDDAALPATEPSADARAAMAFADAAMADDALADAATADRAEVQQSMSDRSPTLALPQSALKRDARASPPQKTKTNSVGGWRADVDDTRHQRHEPSSAGTAQGADAEPTALALTIEWQKVIADFRAAFVPLAHEACVETVAVHAVSDDADGADDSVAFDRSTRLSERRIFKDDFRAMTVNSILRRRIARPTQPLPHPPSVRACACVVACCSLAHACSRAQVLVVCICLPACVRACVRALRVSSGLLVCMRAHSALEAAALAGKHRCDDLRVLAAAPSGVWPVQPRLHHHAAARRLVHRRPARLGREAPLRRAAAHDRNPNAAVHPTAPPRVRRVGGGDDYQPPRRV